MPEVSIVTLVERMLDRENIRYALATGLISAGEANAALDELEERERTQTNIRSHHNGRFSQS